MQISNSPIFVKEFNDFKNKINEVIDPNVKKDLTSLLNQLVTQVKLLEQVHNELVINPRLPSDTGERRSEIVNLRQQITKKLDEYRRAS
jgi:hypothetical protein